MPHRQRPDPTLKVPPLLRLPAVGPQLRVLSRKVLLSDYCFIISSSSDAGDDTFTSIFVGLTVSHEHSDS